LNAAIEILKRLQQKYPSSFLGRRAPMRIGRIYEHLKQYTKALKTYRELRHWRVRYKARRAIRRLQRKELTIFTKRAFHNNEPVHITAKVRNLKKLTIKLYRLDAETYFRKTKTLQEMKQLDIELIRPDRQWDIHISSKPYALHKQRIKIPLKKPTMALVQILGGGLQATTVVLRSDIQIITQHNRQQLFVFAMHKQLRKPQPHVRLLISDGKRIFKEVKTGKDGTFRSNDPQLKKAAHLHILAIHKGSVASTQGRLTGLSVQQSIRPAGLLYTDRPLYKPGETVFLKGILREVKDDQLQTPTQAYTLNIRNPNGQIVWTQTLQPNPLGSVHTRWNSRSDSVLGTYTITLSRKRGPSFSSTFKIKHYTLPKYTLRAKLKRSVFLRGEKISGILEARHGFGARAAHKKVKIRFGGQTHTGKTNAKGQWAFNLKTRELDSERAYTLRLSMPGERTRAKTMVWLQSALFALQLKTQRQVYLARETIPVHITAKDRTNQHYPAKISVRWAQKNPEGEQQLGKQQVQLDAKGHGKITFSVPRGGKIIIHAHSQDAKGRPVHTQKTLFISGTKDKQIVRLLGDREQYQAHETIALKMANRRTGPALLTWIRQGVFAHRFIPTLEKGQHQLHFKADPKFSPNFALQLTLLHKNRFHTVQKQIFVQKKLHVHVQLQKKVYAPGQKATLKIRTTDTAGRPVPAEVSVAMVDQMLLKLASTTRTTLKQTFYRFRHSIKMRTQTSQFRYRAKSRKVDRMLLLLKEERKIPMLAAPKARKPMSYNRYRKYSKYRKKSRKIRNQSRTLRGSGSSSGVGAFGRGASDVSSDHLARQGILGLLENNRNMNRNLTGDLLERETSMRAPRSRTRFATTAYWRAVLRTDTKGELTVTVPLPDNNTTW
ncbi:MAG: MG2 domain-containing protein, partial [Myxococcota bacterium]